MKSQQVPKVMYQLCTAEITTHYPNPEFPSEISFQLITPFKVKNGCLYYYWGLGQSCASTKLQDIRIITVHGQVTEKQFAAIKLNHIRTYYPIQPSAIQPNYLDGWIAPNGDFYHVGQGDQFCCPTNCSYS